MLAPNNSATAAAAAAANCNNSGSSNNNNNNNNNNCDGTKRFVQKYLTKCKSFYSCIYCRTHLANHDELVSRSFQGNRTRAYLFNTVINISCGPAVQRVLNTGSHAVADIYCNNCGTTIGWKYEKAYVETQKYKEGKFIIELAHVVRENRHLELDKHQDMVHHNHHHQSAPASIGTTSGASRLAGSYRRDYNYKHGSVSPTSSGGHWSLASSDDQGPGRFNIDQYANNQDQNHDFNDDDDDNLMFPFYDDLGQEESSYPGSFSSSRVHQNRMRRSLYLDSRPYDWKYSSSSSNDNSISASPPGSSSSASSSSSPPPNLSSPSTAPLTRAKGNNNNNCDHSGDPSDDSEAPQGIKDITSSRGASSREAPESDSEGRNLDLAGEGQPSCSSSSSSSPSSSMKSRPPEAELTTAGADESRDRNNDAQNQSSNSLSLNEDEFYDCCSDHEITNSNSARTSNVPH